ncbi:MAG: phosphonate metabolism transcriptional regulator PhnF [Desulfovibrionales bacterium]
MEIQRRRGTTLWRQIQKLLEQEIGSGRLHPGAQLPTEAELSRRFQVNRHTVRRALSGLQEQGLIRIEQGRGSFVQEHVVSYAVSRRTRFSENLLREKKVPGGTLLRHWESSAGPEIAAALFLPLSSPILSMEILREADSVPLSLAAHHFPLPRFSGMVERFQETGSITSALKDFGIQDYVRRGTRITARMPTEEEALYLRQPRNRPVLVTTTVNVDLRAVPIDYGHTRYASDRVQITLEI